MAAQKAQVQERLAELRDVHDLTQEEAAAKVGVNLRQWQRWEAGDSRPYTRNLEAVAEAFGISTDDILGASEVSGADAGHAEGVLEPFGDSRPRFPFGRDVLLLQGDPLDLGATATPAFADPAAGWPVRQQKRHRKRVNGWKCVALSLVAVILLAGCGGTEKTAAAPADCTAAIDDARAIARTMDQALNAAAGYPKLVPRAALGGATGDTAELDAVARRMKRLNARLERANKRVAAQVESFNAHADG